MFFGQQITGLSALEAQNAKIGILKDVNGVIKPGRYFISFHCHFHFSPKYKEIIMLIENKRLKKSELALVQDDSVAWSSRVWKNDVLDGSRWEAKSLSQGL